MELKHEKYNGWTNYSTWNVFCWMGSDEESQKAAESAAEEGLEHFEEFTLDFISGMEDNTRPIDVNFHEIYSSFRSTYVENKELLLVVMDNVDALMKSFIWAKDLMVEYLFGNHEPSYQRKWLAMEPTEFWCSLDPTNKALAIRFAMENYS